MPNFFLYQINFCAEFINLMVLYILKAEWLLRPNTFYKIATCTRTKAKISPTPKEKDIIAFTIARFK